MGRIRVWLLKDLFDGFIFPPAVVAYSLFNTTIIWRSPFGGHYSMGPLPPIPAFDPNATPSFQSFTFWTNRIAKLNQVLNVQYGAKVAFDPNKPVPQPVTRKHPISGIKKSVPIEVAIGKDEATATPWISAQRQIRKLSGDFSHATETLITAAENGLRLRMKRFGDRYNMNLNFDPSGLSPAMAIQGLEVMELWSYPPPGSHLIFRIADKVELRSLSPLSTTAFDTAQATTNKATWAEIDQAARIIGADLRLPIPAGGAPMVALQVVARAIVHKKPISVTEKEPITFSLPRSLYDTQVADPRPRLWPIADFEYPFAGIPELTEDRIGPVRLCVNLQNGGADLTSSVVSLGQDVVELSFDPKYAVYLFEQFLGSTVTKIEVT